ncbi:MAG: GTP 3',8-cyclase MoaA [Bacteroidetes bacterium]|nr:GTP 3',8-cyclase MoaA [Bacteroidota bacterium]
MLADSFGRVHDYLRISLTEACNLRCKYCMPEDFMPPHHKWYMTREEIRRLAAVFLDLGVNKIRLTGGEPLVRKDAANIIRDLGNEIAQRNPDGKKQLTISTNGILVHRFIDEFKSAGIHSLNVSIDSLMPEQFQEITRRDEFHQLMSNIHLLLHNQFRVKLNVVMMKGVNDNELLEFVHLTRDFPLHVRFIEFMPFAGNHWQQARLITQAEMLERIQSHFDITPLVNNISDTDKKFRVLGHQGSFAFINTMSEPFCAGCNRIRLTADGKLKNCLFSAGEVDLLTPLRNGEDVQDLIKTCIAAKKAKWGGQELFSATENRSMIAIGG